MYLFVSEPDICIERIAQRVALGGHFIPAEVAIRRYHLGLRLLPRYLSVVDAARIYSADGEPRTIASKEAGQLRIEDQRLWQEILPLFDPQP